MVYFLLLRWSVYYKRHLQAERSVPLSQYLWYFDSSCSPRPPPPLLLQKLLMRHSLQPQPRVLRHMVCWYYIQAEGRSALNRLEDLCSTSGSESLGRPVQRATCLKVNIWDNKIPPVLEQHVSVQKDEICRHTSIRERREWGRAAKVPWRHKVWLVANSGMMGVVKVWIHGLGLPQVWPFEWRQHTVLQKTKLQSVSYSLV